MDQEKTTPLKLYYNIREVADSLGLNPSLLRYWETEFPMLQPKKNRKGNRMYTEKDLELFLVTDDVNEAIGLIKKSIARFGLSHEKPHPLKWLLDLTD